jgi:hypothetical protein
MFHFIDKDSRARAPEVPSESPQDRTVHDNEASIASGRFEQESRTRQLADARRSLKDINGVELELVRWEREIELSRAKSRRKADTSEQARIEPALTLTNGIRNSLGEP